MANVVGILPSHDALLKLTDSLKSSGLDLGRLQVISSETPSTELIDTGLRFTYSGDDDTVIGSGGGIMTGFGGTSVPGLTTSNPRISAASGDTVERILGDLRIPETRFDNYANAIESGETVVSYPAGSDGDKVKSLFSAAGANPVEVF